GCSGFGWVQPSAARASAGFSLRLLGLRLGSAFGVRRFVGVRLGHQGSDDAALLLANAGLLAAELTQVEEASPAHDAASQEVDLLDTARVEHEGTLDADAEAHLTHGERRAGTGAVTLDDQALEHLDARLVAFDDAIVDGNGVPDAELRQVASHVLRFE